MKTVGERRSSHRRMCLEIKVRHWDCIHICVISSHYNYYDLLNLSQWREYSEKSYEFPPKKIFCRSTSTLSLLSNRHPPPIDHFMFLLRFTELSLLACGRAGSVGRTVLKQSLHTTFAQHSSLWQFRCSRSTRLLTPLSLLLSTVKPHLSFVVFCKTTSSTTQYFSKQNSNLWLTLRIRYRPKPTFSSLVRG